MQIWGLEKPVLLGQILPPLQTAVGGDPLLNRILTISQGHCPFFSKLLVRKCAGFELFISRQNKPQRKLEETGRECIASVLLWLLLLLRTVTDSGTLPDPIPLVTQFFQMSIMDSELLSLEIKFHV